MDRKEKIQKFFKYFLIGITIFLLGFAFWCAGKLNNDTNNVINASADSNEVVNLPFDYVVSSTNAMCGFNYAQSNVWRDIPYLDGYEFSSLKVNFDTTYNIVFNNSNAGNQSLLGRYFLVRNYNETNINTLDLTTFNYDDNVIDNFIVPIDNTSNYKMVLSQFNENETFFVCRNRNYVFTPLIKVDILGGLSELTQTILYNTSLYSYVGASDVEYDIVKNICDYQYFRITTYSRYGEGNVEPSINGYTNRYPTLSERIFRLNPEMKYQEGYNAGYDEGYQNGVNDTLESMAFNPFNDDWKMGASVMAYQHGGDIITPSNPASPYYQYTTYGIRETFSLKSAYSQIYTDYMAYITFSRYVFSLKDYTDDGIKITEGLQLKYGYYNIPENVEGTFTNLAGENITIEMVLKRLSDQNATLITLDFVSTDAPIIDFSNINNVDYTDYYLREFTVLKYGNTPFNALYYKAIEFNQYLGTYAQGYQNGYNSGISKSNYQKGYNAGYNDAKQLNGYSFFSLFAALIDTPIHYLNTLFNYEILGMNIKNFLLALLTIAIVIAAIRFATGKKE